MVVLKFNFHLKGFAPCRQPPQHAATRCAGWAYGKMHPANDNRRVYDGYRHGAGDLCPASWPELGDRGDAEREAAGALGRGSAGRGGRRRAALARAATTHGSRCRKHAEFGCSHFGFW